MTAQSEINPVTFENRSGFELFGMLHIPPEFQVKTGIIILSPGIKNRVAPHRLYVKMARRFSSLGFPVLRFDPEGLGDSAGHIDEKFTADLYGSIQVGRFVDDTIDAMDWMEKKYGISRFILAGLCGGAITGLLAGANDFRVKGLLGLGIPVILDSASVDQARYITEGQLMSMGENYVKKVFSPKAWLRFITFRSDYRIIFRYFMKVVRRGSKKESANPVPAPKNGQAIAQPNGNFNPYFPIAFHNFIASSRDMLLVFSEKDRLYWEFEEKFLSQHTIDPESGVGKWRVEIIKYANHIFSFKEWQEEMITKSCSWFTENIAIPIEGGAER